MPSPTNTPYASASEPHVGAVRGAVTVLLRLEGAAVLTASLASYHVIGGSWVLFAALFLLPDVSMLGYLLGPRAGAAFYNALHTYAAPAALALLGWSLGLPMLLALAIIWTAHIGFDRLMGYGLKYASAFGATHLGWRGKRQAAGCAANDPWRRRRALVAAIPRPRHSRRRLPSCASRSRTRQPTARPPGCATDACADVPVADDQHELAQRSEIQADFATTDSSVVPGRLRPPKHLRSRRAGSRS